MSKLGGNQPRTPVRMAAAKAKPNDLNKELYRKFRQLSLGELWQEISRFDQASAAERASQVALVRAVGVVFSESAPAEEKQKARQWLIGLLEDPVEKIRRYAMTALPKLGSSQAEEAALVHLLQRTQNDREKGFLGKALEKIGAEATLEAFKGSLSPQSEQKVRANIARANVPTTILLDRILQDCSGLLVHLRGRKGLEQLVQEEVQERLLPKGQFRIRAISSGLVELEALKSFSLQHLYSLRCFGTLGLCLGRVRKAKPEELIESIASLIASKLALKILTGFTEGPLRYRLEFPNAREQTVKAIANRIYSRRPELLNDSRQAPWAIEVMPTGGDFSIELRPRFSPDPRLAYRQKDVPAASHPPLAACMARLAGPKEGEVVWDPFCGSGLELVERAMLGGVRAVYGTDKNPAAIEIAERNFASAGLPGITADFIHCDFREFRSAQGMGANSVTLVISNPPLGKRVPVPNLRAMFEDLFRIASSVLRPGGRLVIANPFRMELPCGDLKLKYRQTVDFGGFNCRLEKYVKVGQG